MSAHVGGQKKAGIGLIDGIALRAGEVDKMFAEFQHLRASRLLSGFICQMGGSDCEKWLIAHNPTPAVIQERRTVCMMRAHRITGAQRGLEIRGLNESTGSGLG